MRQNGGEKDEQNDGTIDKRFDTTVNYCLADTLEIRAVGYSLANWIIICCRGKNLLAQLTVKSRWRD